MIMPVQKRLPYFSERVSRAAKRHFYHIFYLFSIKRGEKIFFHRSYLRIIFNVILVLLSVLS